MLKTTSVLAVVLALCCAQEGPRLDIPETFEAGFQSTVMFHGKTRKGTGTWYRSVSLEAVKRIDKIVNETGEYIFEHLALFREKMDYNIEGTHCEKRPMPEGFEFQMIWRDFEERGHYGGERTEIVGNTTVRVYVWDMQERDEHVELWAKPPMAPSDEIKEPFAMKRMGREGEFTTIFTSFITEFSDDVFKPPASCEMATDNKTPSHPQRPTGDNTHPRRPTGDNTRPQRPQNSMDN